MRFLLSIEPVVGLPAVDICFSFAGDVQFGGCKLLDGSTERESGLDDRQQASMKHLLQRDLDSV